MMLVAYIRLTPLARDRGVEAASIVRRRLLSRKRLTALAADDEPDTVSMLRR